MTTTLSDRRKEAMDLGFEIHREELAPAGIDRAYYDAFLEGWDVRAIERDGEVIGVRYTKDGRLHVSVKPAFHGRWMTRSILREIFDMPRVIVTRMPPDNPVHGLLLRLGFTDAGDDTLVRES